MIRLRKADGTVTPVDQSTFVEIVDMDNKVAMVVFQTPDGVIHTLNRRSPDAARYASMFNLEFCPAVELKE